MFSTKALWKNVHLIAILMAVFSLPCLADSEIDYDHDGDVDSGDLAQASQNPIANLVSLPFQNNTYFKFGPREKTQNVMNIQPVWPVELNDNWNLITRTILPVISQPPFTPGQDRKNGIGDTLFTAYFSPKNSGRLIWGVGPAILLPTSNDDRLGVGEWGAGPAAVFLTMQGPWVVGTLLSNIWSSTNNDDVKVNLFTWQYFINLVSGQLTDHQCELGGE